MAVDITNPEDQATSSLARPMIGDGVLPGSTLRPAGDADLGEAREDVGPLMADHQYHPVSSKGDPQWPRRVGVGIKIENVLSVDNVANRFEAILKVSYEWQLTRREHELFKLNHWTVKDRPPWEPDIVLPTAQKVEKTELLVPHSVEGAVFSTFEHRGQVYTVVYMRLRCIFSETYELQSFPFDCQDLTFVFMSADATKATLHPRFKRDDFVSVDMENCQLPEWDFHKPVLTIETNTAHSRSGTKRLSRFVLQLKIKRRHNFYVNRIMHTAALLTFGSLLTWSIDVELPHRLMLCFTIILTMVAFQMAMANKLPQVRYFTMLDIYLLLCQRFVVMTAIEHAALKRWFPEDRRADDFCFLCTAILYFLLQLIFWICVRRSASKEEEKLVLNAPQLQDWLQKRRQNANPTTTSGEMMISSQSGSLTGSVSGTDFETYNCSRDVKGDESKVSLMR